MRTYHLVPGQRSSCQLLNMQTVACFCCSTRSGHWEDSLAVCSPVLPTHPEQNQLQTEYHCHRLTFDLHRQLSLIVRRVITSCSRCRKTSCHLVVEGNKLFKSAGSLTGAAARTCCRPGPGVHVQLLLLHHLSLSG